jgi:hypothetical protein
MTRRPNIPFGTACDSCRLLDLGNCYGARGGIGCDGRKVSETRPFTSGENVIRALPDCMMSAVSSAAAVCGLQSEIHLVCPLPPGRADMHAVEPSVAGPPDGGGRVPASKPKPPIVSEAMRAYYRVLRGKFSRAEIDLSGQFHAEGA